MLILQPWASTSSISRTSHHISRIRNPLLSKLHSREGLLNYLADNQNAWEMRADGCYERRLPAPGEAPFSAQLAMLDALNA